MTPYRDVCAEVMEAVEAAIHEQQKQRLERVRRATHDRYKPSLASVADEINNVLIPRLIHGDQIVTERSATERALTVVVRDSASKRHRTASLPDCVIEDSSDGAVAEFVKVVLALDYELGHPK